MAHLWIILLAYTSIVLVQGSTLVPRDSPVVVLDSATFQGTTSGAVASFLGIPFAKPP